jgi:hypothetical protein
MPQSSFGRWFWPRAVALQFLLLGLWWFVLYQPSLFLLRVVGEVPFTLFTPRQEKDALDVDTSGDWKFSVPVSPFAHDDENGRGRVIVNAIEFSGPSANVAPFTTGWFVYLGLALNLPLTRSRLRRTLLGLLLQMAAASLGLFAYAEVNAIGIATNMHPVPNAAVLWLTKLAYHIDYLVVPYASPFLILLLTHPVWWLFLTKGSSEAEAALKSGDVSKPLQPVKKGSRGRRTSADPR